MEAEKTKEQLYEEDLQRLRGFRPMDDDFMRMLFRKNLPLSQLVLRIITGIDDLIITEEETQHDLKRLVGARSLCLDVYGTDSSGKNMTLRFNVRISVPDLTGQDTIPVLWMSRICQRIRNLRNCRIHIQFLLQKMIYMVPENRYIS